MEEIIEKPKRTRKRKGFPSFSLMEKQDVSVSQMSVSLNQMHQLEREYENLEGVSVCPYTEYIPIHYIFNTPINRIDIYFLSEHFSKKLKGKTKPVINDIIKKKREIFEEFSPHVKQIINNNENDSMGALNSYLSFDNIIENISRSGYESRLQNVLDIFTGECGWRRESYFRARSYSGYAQYLSLHRENIPEVIAVVLPENYMYTKLKLIKEGVIDLSRVIVLVNRELDSTSYPSAPFRAFYKKYIEPYLKTTACDVWKVPSEYIQKKCFLYDYKIEESNIIKRKEKIAEFIESFIEKASGEGLSQRPEPEADIFGDSYTFRMPEVIFTTTPTFTISAASSTLIYADSVEQTTYTAGVDPYRQQGEMESST